MFESPKSLTATIYVRFNYKEPESQPSEETRTEIIGKILDRASELAPELQEILAKFTDYLNQLDPKKEGQDSAKADGQSSFK